MADHKRYYRPSMAGNENSDSLSRADCIRLAPSQEQAWASMRKYYDEKRELEQEVEEVKRKLVEAGITISMFI